MAAVVGLLLLNCAIHLLLVVVFLAIHLLKPLSARGSFDFASTDRSSAMSITGALLLPCGLWLGARQRVDWSRSAALAILSPD